MALELDKDRDPTLISVEGLGSHGNVKGKYRVLFTDTVDDIVSTIARDFGVEAEYLLAYEDNSTESTTVNLRGYIAAVLHYISDPTKPIPVYSKLWIGVSTPPSPPSPPRAPGRGKPAAKGNARKPGGVSGKVRNTTQRKDWCTYINDNADSYLVRDRNGTLYGHKP